MYTRELRIGNIFCPMDRSKDVHMPATAFPLRVIEINTFKISACLPEENPALLEKWREIDINDVCGIPLTEEWLKKFGFEYDGGSGYKAPDNTEHWYFTLRNGFMPNACATGSVESDKYVGCQYVHQLQNLYFALTGDELTVIRISK